MLLVIVERSAVSLGTAGSSLGKTIRQNGQGSVTSPARHPATPDELAAFLLENAQGENRPLIPVGGGTWLDYGRPVSAGVKLHTSGLAQVRDYPVRDMTVTVEAGLTLSRLSEILAEERQQIPVDFPQPEEATIGGAIAANVSGPRRFGLGTLRDYLIGIEAVDAKGRVFHAGGRVVKNVAGYDLCKLMVGSWGTLAVLTEVTLKVVPIPETLAWVWSTWDSSQKLDRALESLLTSAARPIAVEVLNQIAADQLVASSNQELPASTLVLALLVAGSETDVDWQTRTLSAELHAHQPNECVTVSDSAEALLKSLTGFPITPCPLSFQANLPASRTIEFAEAASKAGFLVQAHAANGVVIGKASEDVSTSGQAHELITPLRTLAESNGGSLVIQNCPSDWKSQIDVFGAANVNWDLMRKLKHSLDPANLLSPNRLFDSE